MTQEELALAPGMAAVLIPPHVNQALASAYAAVNVSQTLIYLILLCPHTAIVGGCNWCPYRCYMVPTSPAPVVAPFVASISATTTAPFAASVAAPVAPILSTESLAGFSFNAPTFSVASEQLSYVPSNFPTIGTASVITDAPIISSVETGLPNLASSQPVNTIEGSVGVIAP